MAPVLVDRASVVIAGASEEYLTGEQHFRAGQMEKARAHFDAAVLRYLDSGLDMNSDLRLHSAFERLVADIRALESEALAEVEDSTPIAPTPVEEIEEITSFVGPDELALEKERMEGEPQEQEYSIPIVLNEQVLTFIEAFQKTPRLREAFRGGYQRMGRYEPMIRKVLEEEGVPQDLIYLSFIESTFKPMAYSRARAKGMWQFMAATGSRYGLARDYYVDERSDPEKATRAAARYLRDLHEMFGDWYLAMAAYNAGEMKVTRAIQRSGRKDFWELARTRHLRQETKNFVPSILALSIMSRDPGRYGQADIVKDPPLEYDRVVLEGPTDISLIAELAGTTPDRVRELNPHLRRSITPPGVDRFSVRVPAGSGESFERAYATLPDSERIASVMVRYTVQNGDTLNRIAKEHGTTVAALAQANGMTSRSRIYAGSTLLVPRGEGAPSAWRRPEGWGEEEASPDGTYTVRRGDTLSAIASRHGTTPHAVASLSGIAIDSILRPGQTLQVRPGAEPQAAAPAAAPARSETSYTVQRGDTLLTIARGHGTTIGAIEALNGISRHAAIHPGQVLRMLGGADPQSTPQTASLSAGERLTYTVRRGDSLYAIATRYGTTVERLKSWNNMGGRSRIYPGEVLSIYAN